LDVCVLQDSGDLFAEAAQRHFASASLVKTTGP